MTDKYLALRITLFVLAGVVAIDLISDLLLSEPSEWRAIFSTGGQEVEAVIADGTREIGKGIKAIAIAAAILIALFAPLGNGVNGKKGYFNQPKSVITTVFDSHFNDRLVFALGQAGQINEYTRKLKLSIPQEIYNADYSQSDVIVALNNSSRIIQSLILSKLPDEVKKLTPSLTINFTKVDDAVEAIVVIRLDGMQQIGKALIDLVFDKCSEIFNAKISDIKRFYAQGESLSIDAAIEEAVNREL